MLFSPEWEGLKINQQFIPVLRILLQLVFAPGLPQGWMIAIGGPDQPGRRLRWYLQLHRSQVEGPIFA